MAMVYEAESNFCLYVLNLLLEKYKVEIETKFSASSQSMRIAISSKKQFRIEDMEYIVNCLNEEFERYAMSRLRWTLKPKIKSSRYNADFPLSVIFVYSKNKIVLTINKNNTKRKICVITTAFNLNNGSRYCWQTMS